MLDGAIYPIFDVSFWKVLRLSKQETFPGEWSFWSKSACMPRLASAQGGGASIGFDLILGLQKGGCRSGLSIQAFSMLFGELPVRSAEMLQIGLRRSNQGAGHSEVPLGQLILQKVHLAAGVASAWLRCSSWQTCALLVMSPKITTPLATAMAHHPAGKRSEADAAAWAIHRSVKWLQSL